MENRIRFVRQLFPSIPFCFHFFSLQKYFPEALPCVHEGKKQAGEERGEVKPSHPFGTVRSLFFSSDGKSKIYGKGLTARLWDEVYFTHFTLNTCEAVLQPSVEVRLEAN